MKLRSLIFAASLALMVSCSTTRVLQDGQYMLKQNKVVVDSKDYNAAELGSYMRQKPNSSFFGFNPFISIYNWGTKDNAMGRFWRKIGEAPVVYEASMVDETISNIEKHLVHTGYYGSTVESQIRVKNRKVYVTYYVALGKRFSIESIDYDLPSDDTFRSLFLSDVANSSVHEGDYLSESMLDKEADRSAKFFRDNGYYGFNKSMYSFEADTLASDGKARLKMKINSVKPVRYTIADISISHPKQLKLRKDALENLNLLRPGDMYNEKAVNTTYSRFASVQMLSGVNINTEPAGEDKVNCQIRLSNSKIQGFKTNLEASVNSTGLLGISPQLNYYHKNIFHGGEILNISLKGNFQFMTSDPSAYVTELTVAGNIKFPQALGFPNRLYKGPNIPRTEVGISYAYQDRPEFRRNMISATLAYSGRIGNNISYQLLPFRTSIVRMFDVREDFFNNMLMKNPFLMSVYSDYFDMGISGNLYYSTNFATIPKTPYHYVRLSMDLSGNFLSLFNRAMPLNQFGQRTIWDTPYSQYVRMELNTGKVFRFGYMDKQSVALHACIGAGYAYGNSLSMPIEKYFYAGGSKSMRGWQARMLGPGNTSSEVANMYLTIPSQIGDVKLEVNAEYRFPMFWKFEGAAFLDVGNIWYMSDEDGLSPESVLMLKNLPQSIAANWGLGLRLNFDLLLVRLDVGVKLHDPMQAEGARWIGPSQWIKGNNVALHFGVGYPF